MIRVNQNECIFFSYCRDKLLFLNTCGKDMHSLKIQNVNGVIHLDAAKL